jgi:hypothetical protein
MNAISHPGAVNLSQTSNPVGELTRVVGTLEPYFETGTEGIVWSLHTSGVPGYDGLNCLKKGDDLLVYNPDGTALWAGEIDLEYQRCHQPFPMNPQYGKQAINNMWVNGIQADVDPETWFGWFQSGLPAVAWISSRLPDNAATDSIARTNLLNMNKEREALTWALDSVLSNPDAAWTIIEKENANLAKRIADHAAHFLKYYFDQLHWKALKIDLAGQGMAHTWQLLVALDRAGRTLGGGLKRSVSQPTKRGVMV